MQEAETATERIPEVVILRSGTRRRISDHVDIACDEIFRGVYPELIEGLRMTFIGTFSGVRWAGWKPYHAKVAFFRRTAQVAFVRQLLYGYRLEQRI